MTDIRNERQLRKILEEQTAGAINDTADEVLDLFLKDYIEKFAYIDNPKMYDRTMEFKNSWEFSDLKKSAMSISRELWFNDSKMTTFDTSKFIHGSIYSTPRDVRSNLPSILEGKRSKLWISVERRVKFWEKFISDMFSGGKLEQILNKHFSKRGFVKG